MSGWNRRNLDRYRWVGKMPSYDKPEVSDLSLSGLTNRQARRMLLRATRKKGR